MAASGRVVLENACAVVLGRTVVDALNSANVTLPRIHDMAMRQAFVYENVPPLVKEILISFAKKIDETGLYE